MCILKLSGRMRKTKRALTCTLILIILVSTSAIGDVSSALENPDEIDEDHATLFESLNRTTGEMRTVLEEALSVDYNLYENEIGNLSFDYDGDALTNSTKIAEMIELEMSSPGSVFAEIEGKEIESADFLEEYYIPIYDLSVNLTHYSRRHSDMISNMSSLMVMDVEGEKRLAGDIHQAFNNTHHHLIAMEERLSNINSIFLQKRGDDVNVTGFQRLISENEEMLDRYMEKFQRVGNELDIPPTLFIYGPESVHPGESLEIEVEYFDGDGISTSADISLLKDGVTAEIGYQIDEDNYLFIYDVDWDAKLWSDIQFSAIVDGSEIVSDDLILQVIPYPSSIELETEKDAYHDEMITINGEFNTEAPVDLTEIDLYGSEEKTNPDANGTFQLEYESEIFRWGRSQINVSYEGAENNTILPSYDSVIIEVSIPTDIEILHHTENIRHDDLENFVLEGRLVNISGDGEENHQGIPSENISFYLDGEYIGEVQTDDEGFFTFYFSDDKSIQNGTHVLSLSFDGSEKYRSVDSQEVAFEVVEEDGFLNDPFFIGIIAILIIAIFGSIYIFGSKSDDKDITKSKLAPGSGTSPSEVSIPSVTREKDITDSYIKFLKFVQETGIIELRKGKTHREILDEMISHERIEGVGEELSLVTDIFEKKIFTERDITRSEIQEFNSSLSSLMREVSP